VRETAWDRGYSQGPLPKVIDSRVLEHALSITCNGTSLTFFISTERKWMPPGMLAADRTKPVGG